MTRSTCVSKDKAYTLVGTMMVVKSMSLEFYRCCYRCSSFVLIMLKREVIVSFKIDLASVTYHIMSQLYCKP